VRDVKGGAVRYLGIVCAIATVLSWGSAQAQTNAFRSDVGMMTYVVRPEQAAAFEQVLERVVQGLKAAGTVEHPHVAIGLRTLKAVQGFAAGGVLYVLLVEPVVPGVDYSIERLITDTLPSDAADLIRRFRVATEGAQTTIASLKTMGMVAPADALRSRLEAELGDQLVPGAPGPGDPDGSEERRLDSLRRPSWAVDHVQYDVADRKAATWQFTWRFDVRNSSLLQPLLADVSVEFRDNEGAVVAASPPVRLSVDPQDRRPVTGELGIAAASAARVVNAVVKVDARP
jgi:hypothetical protein